MAALILSRTLRVIKSSCTSAREQNTSSRKRLGTPSALRLRGAASRIRFSNPPLNPRTHPGCGGVHEEVDPEQVGLFFLLLPCWTSFLTPCWPSLFSSPDKLDVAVIGGRPFFRIIRVTHDSHAIDQWWVFAEGFLIVFIDIA